MEKGKKRGGQFCWCVFNVRWDRVGPGPVPVARGGGRVCVCVCVCVELNAGHAQAQKEKARTEQATTNDKTDALPRVRGTQGRQEEEQNVGRAFGEDVGGHVLWEQRRCGARHKREAMGGGDVEGTKRAVLFKSGSSSGTRRLLILSTTANAAIFLLREGHKANAAGGAG